MIFKTYFNHMLLHQAVTTLLSFCVNSRTPVEKNCMRNMEQRSWSGYFNLLFVLTPVKERSNPFLILPCLLNRGHSSIHVYVRCNMTTERPNTLFVSVPYYQTTEQILFSGCEIPQLVLSPPSWNNSFIFMTYPTR